MIALSTMEAEYIAAAAVVQVAVWLKSLLISLEVVPHAADPITLHSDSMSAIGYSKDSKFHGLTKRIEIKYHFGRNKKDDVTFCTHSFEINENSVIFCSPYIECCLLGRITVHKCANEI